MVGFHLFYAVFDNLGFIAIAIFMCTRAFISDQIGFHQEYLLYDVWDVPYR